MAWTGLELTVLCERRQTHTAPWCGFRVWETSRAGKSLEMNSTSEVARGWERKIDNASLFYSRPFFGKTKMFWNEIEVVVV